MSLKVLSVASEAVPLVKTGGLADVAGALPGALAAHGIEMTTLLPGYPQVTAAARKAKAIHTWPSLLGQPARLLSARMGDHPLLIVDAPAYFDRPGGPYGDAAGTGRPVGPPRVAPAPRSGREECPRGRGCGGPLGSAGRNRR